MITFYPSEKRGQQLHIAEGLRRSHIDSGWISVFYAFYGQNEGLWGPFVGRTGGLQQKFHKVIIPFLLFAQRSFSTNLKVLTQKTLEKIGFEIFRARGVLLIIRRYSFIEIREMDFYTTFVLNKIYGWGQKHWKGISQQINMEKAIYPPPLSF